MDMRGANHTLKIQKSRWLPTSTSSWSDRGQVGTSEWASCTQSRSELLPRWERRGLQIPQNGPAPEISTWVVGSLDLLWLAHLGEEEDHVCHSPHNALRAWDERVKLQFRAFFSKRHQHPCRRYYISWRSPSRPWRWWGALGCTWWWPPFFSPPPPSMIIFILP